MAWLAWLVAVVVAAGLITLWLFDARRVLREKCSTVESAAGQLAVCRKKLREHGGASEYAQVLDRSESIYRQAAENYNSALKKPWLYLPGKLLGYHKEETE